MTEPTDATAAAKPPKGAASIRETLTSVMIAFVMAFVFRGFVIEGFLIPTGSMAPTLLGQHMRFTSPDSGYDWTVGPWDFMDRSAEFPSAVQGATTPIRADDPMTDASVQAANVPLRWGDRVFVLKYLYSVYDPARWDVIVFKNPSEPRQNFIKRLIALPGEQVAIVDGDVFTRPTSGEIPPSRSLEAWNDTDWRIARKPERIQRALWMPVSDSRYTPPSPATTFRPPWTASDARWEGLRDSRSYRYTGSGPTTLEWNHRRPIVDSYPYNQSRRGFPPSLHVPDINMRFGIEPEADGLVVEADLLTLGLRFRARIEGDNARIERRDEDAGETAWTLVDEGTLRRPLRPGRVTNIEFWHADQAVSLWIDGRLVAGGNEHGAYEWSPAERIRRATGRPLENILAQDDRGNPLATTDLYRRPELAWHFDGGPFTLHRVAVDRDLYHRAHEYTTQRSTPQTAATAPGRPALATHPDSTLTLGPDQFFTVGDNSPNSHDGRLWSYVDPWIGEQIDPTIGVVHRDLIIGKAFVVYFPSVLPGPLPRPDFGRMRWIW